MIYKRNGKQGMKKERNIQCWALLGFHDLADNSKMSITVLPKTNAKNTYHSKNLVMQFGLDPNYSCLFSYVHLVNTIIIIGSSKNIPFYYRLYPLIVVIFSVLNLYTNLRIIAKLFLIEFGFFCLMAHQTSWAIWCQIHPCRRITGILFNSWLLRIKGVHISEIEYNNGTRVWTCLQ